MAKKIKSSELRMAGDIGWAKTNPGKCAVCGSPSGTFVYCDGCSGEAHRDGAYARIDDEEALSSPEEKHLTKLQVKQLATVTADPALMVDQHLAHCKVCQKALVAYWEKHPGSAKKGFRKLFFGSGS